MKDAHDSATLVERVKQHAALYEVPTIWTEIADRILELERLFNNAAKERDFWAGYAGRQEAEVARLKMKLQAYETERS